MEITLDLLPVEQSAVVQRIETASLLSKRIRAFGIVPGTRVLCCCRTPDGAVTALEAHGAVLALRTKDLKEIWGCC